MPETIEDRVDSLEKSSIRLTSFLTSELGGNGTLGNVNRNINEINKNVTILKEKIDSRFDKIDKVIDTQENRIDKLEKMRDRVLSFCFAFIFFTLCYYLGIFTMLAKFIK